MIRLSSRPAPKWRIRILLALFILVFSVALIWFIRITQMPLHSYRGALPASTAEEMGLRDRLKNEVNNLSVKIGDRSFLRPQALEATADYLTHQLSEQGYTVAAYPYQADGLVVRNLEAVWPGQNDNIGEVVVGAHYDSVAGTVGADDNCTGVAAVLELARLLRQTRLRRTIRFVFFVNEEPPHFQTAQMGSRVYAHVLRNNRISVSAMISMETIGFYSDRPHSQQAPPILGFLYPDKGNFIAFVGNSASRSLVRQSIRSFRRSTSFPSEGIAAPEQWLGIGWSDQWSFWQEGYPGIMVTDTAPFRDPYYHTAQDTVDKIDFDRTARVVEGMRKVIQDLGNSPGQ